jgi:hypothetical protein
MLLLVLFILSTATAFAMGYALASRQRARRQALPGAASSSEARERTRTLTGAASSSEARERTQMLTGAPPDTPTPAEPQPEKIAFARLAAEGTPEWRLAMFELGERMRAAGVRFVVFAHGSFVGDDPLAIARSVENAVPFLPDIARALRGFTRDQVSRVLGDLSNFSSSYVETFAGATGIDAMDFTWSGENHHAARVQATVRLARALVLRGGGALRAGDRVVLVGHSHGGQLFAILSQLLARASGYSELVEAAGALGEDVASLDMHLSLLRRCTIDVATFGTPLRYGWARIAGFRVLHVVNHRGDRPRAPSLRHLLYAGRGDYVHQLGTHGSDLPATSAKDRELNARLDRVLGIGSDVRAWLRHVTEGLRISPDGHTMLVDYGEKPRRVPSFWSTGFGHAVYTRREAMLFHTQLVANHFYPIPAGAAWGERVRGWIAPRKLLLPRPPRT